VSGLIWATAVTILGYSIGAFFNVSMEEIKNNLFIILPCFACFGLLLGYIVQRVVNRQ
jgi:membrane protein DedA with SNARE-associated domain